MKFLCIAVGIHAKATVILTLHFLSFYCFFFYKIRTLHPEKTTVIVNFLIIPLCFRMTHCPKRFWADMVEMKDEF